MAKSFPQVDNWNDVIQNVVQFNNELKDPDFASSLSKFKNWYYIPELDLFGPSKFIGYKDNCVVSYNNGHRTSLQKKEGFKARCGGETTRVLRKWFKASTDSTLETKLNSLFVHYNKSPNKQTQIFQPK